MRSSHARRRLAVAALAAVALGACSEAEAPRSLSDSGGGAVPPPGVLLLVIDTLRADHLGAYGHARDTTPHIDALAAEASVYTRAYSQAPWTTPSIASLLTSEYPSRLGIRGARSALPEGAVTLAELLRDAGFATGAVVSHSFCSSRWGFGQGFDGFDESNVLGHAAVTSPGVTDRAREFLDAHAGEPFFLFAHYFDPHVAYVDHPEFSFPRPASGYSGPIASGILHRELVALQERLGPADVDELHRIYDAEIAFTDHHVGRLLEHLRELGRLDDTLIVLTADHGEEFLDHGQVGHAKTLYDELIRVPLLLRVPGKPPRVVAEPVALLDVYPTIAAWLGLAPAAPVRGRNLLAATADGEDPPPVFSETDRSGGRRSIVRGRHKLISDATGGSLELYDLVSDPGETRNLAEARPQRAAELRRDLSLWLRANRDEAASAPTLELSDEEEERLRQLGYL